jgi:hypothetical protein
MKLGSFAIATGALALGCALWPTPGSAQGPMYDRIKVNLPYTVTLGDKTLPPGDYVIQQNRDSGGGSRVLLIYGDNGMKFETTAMTIPALDPNTARDTTVILHHFGNDYYFDKVWVQGKDYGYEFPVPDSVRAREKERMADVTVPAQYSTENTTTATTTSPTPDTQSNTNQTYTGQTTTAENTPPANPAPQPEPAPTTAHAAEPAPPSPPPSTTPESSMAPATTDNTANREMPETDAGWVTMLLSGGALSTLGLALRRKR